ncbi:MAG: MBL fold metallo-hydrolase [Alphaproteobacteria bacterium]
MQLTFLGAAGTVTGSRYLIETAGKKILIDCGLFQGYKDLRLRNWAQFPVQPHAIDAVILSHAHLDHSGYIPLLVKQGFRGRIYCTAPTFDLCKLLLPDSGYLQEEDARRANRYGYTKHKPALPLYTLTDAEESLKYFHPVPFEEDIALDSGIHFRFERAGHILGAASILLTAENKTILFSGDLGRPNDPVIKAPTAPSQADYLVIESTYGNKRHDPVNPIDQLEQIITDTAARGGAVIVPSFAVGRAQSLIYYIHVLKKSQRIPNIPVYLDSPMAINATDIMEKYLSEHRLSKAICSAMTNAVTYVHTPEESKKLDENHFPKIIIAASGMATGGRVLHHIEHLGPDHRNTIVFAGFQAGGTRGDRMLRGEKDIKIHGTMVRINAEIDQLHSVSAHADYKEIIDWCKHLQKPPITTFITHGEASASEAMKNHMEQSLPQWSCVIPHHSQTVKL